MKSIYIAARYSKRDELKPLASELKARGIDVTSRWLKETAPLNVQLQDVPHKEQREIALEDLHDIDEAEGFLFFAEPQDQQPPRGGRHVEFGFALKGGKAIHVIGAPENVFHAIPGIRHYCSAEEFLCAIA